MCARENRPFNNPFAEAKPGLKKRLKKWRAEQREAERAAAQAPPAPEPPSEPDDEQSFAREMSDVAPLTSDPRVGPRREETSPASIDNADAEAYAALADLVAGQGAFDISDTVEYVEGLAPGVDRRLLKRLKQGDYSQQAHLDLHGLTRVEAREAVERFLAEGRVQGKRCVVLIHGRGLNSPDGVPVLKNALVAWLTRGGLAKRILAFATARPMDGGAGALYVLLRK